jgi:tetratricopeptide (TPR) repeat protein
MTRSPDHPITRFFLAAAVALIAALPLEAQLSPLDLEEASEVARRAATAALRGQQRILFEALDIDGILERRLGNDVWSRLTRRQRDPLRALVGRTFAAALSPPRSSAGEVAWSSAREDGPDAQVFLGIRLGDRWLKTRWTLRRAAPGGWRIEDVALGDPGVSLAAESLRPLGAHPVRTRDRRRQAREEAYPRLLGIGTILLVVVLLYRRLPPPKRSLLLLTASAPAFLFAADGILSVRRALAEPYTISAPPAAMPWERWIRLAREAESEGLATADPLWQRALSAGAADGPIAYERGLAARDRGDLEAAGQFFQAALAAREPAPGASRELAQIALAQGRNAEARLWVDRYLEATGPDPEALSLQAVIQTNLARPQEALASIRKARELVGGGARGSELEARVRARLADAAGTVAALREIEPVAGLDRDALRADPAYLPIANDPAWVAFVNETPVRPTAPPQGSR